MEQLMTARNYAREYAKANGLSDREAVNLERRLQRYAEKAPDVMKIGRGLVLPTTRWAELMATERHVGRPKNQPEGET